MSGQRKKGKGKGKDKEDDVAGAFAVDFSMEKGKGIYSRWAARKTAKYSELEGYAVSRRPLRSTSCRALPRGCFSDFRCSAAPGSAAALSRRPPRDRPERGCVVST